MGFLYYNNCISLGVLYVRISFVFSDDFAFCKLVIFILFGALFCLLFCDGMTFHFVSFIYRFEKQSIPICVDLQRGVMGQSIWWCSILAPVNMKVVFILLPK